MTCQVGQTWRWFNEDEDHPMYSWDDLWLLLDNPHLNDEAWDALNLATGERQTIFPGLSPDHYERFA